MPEPLALYLPNLNGGGMERAMLALAESFAARGHPVDLVLARAEGPLLGEVPDGVRLIDLSAPRVFLSLRGLVRYLRAERPHALLSAPKHANLIALWARSLAGVGTRIVISERNALGEASANAQSALERLLPGLMRLSYGRADAVVAVSRTVADDLCRTIGLPRTRVRCIYNPVVTPRLAERMAEPVDHPWFGPGQPPVILGVGRLVPQKDFRTLVRAFAALRAHRPARLLILGEGPEREALESLVAALGLGLGLDGEASLPGFAPNPCAYMRRAGVFALSSRWEGLPGALIEALACGARVVSTDCPGGAAEVLEGGRWGRLVPVGDAARLAEAIGAALDDASEPDVTERLQAFELEAVTDAYLDTLLAPDAATARRRERPPKAFAR